MLEKIAGARTPVAIGLAALVIGGGLWWTIGRQESARAAGTQIKANGTIEADEVEVGAQRSARLLRYKVVEGESVKAGQVIAELDTSELAAQLGQAEGAFRVAVETLKELQVGTRAEEKRRSAATVRQMQALLRGAEKNLGTAATAYRKRTSLKTALDAAETQLKVAQEGLRSAQATKAGAQDALNTAKEDYETTVGLRQARDTAQTQLETAQANYRTAKANLDQLLNGTRSEDLRAAEATLAQNVASVLTARQESENAASDLVRSRDLHKGNALSDQALDTAITRADTARSRLAAAVEARNQAQARLDLLRTGARKEEIESAQGAVQQAQAQIEGAKRAMETSTQSLELRLGTRGALEAARSQDRVADAQLASARATLAGAELAVRNARTSFTDALPERTGLDTNIQQHEAAVAQLEAAQAQLEQANNGATREQLLQARARVQQAKGALDLARVQQEQSVIKASVDGVVTEHVAQVGEVVNPGSTVARLVPLDQVYLTLYVPTSELGRVKINQRVEVKTDTYKGKVYPGSVEWLSDTPEFTPRNVQTPDERVKLVFQVKVKVDNGGRDLKPGMPADATIFLQ